MTTTTTEVPASHNEVLTVEVKRGIGLSEVQRTVADLGNGIAERVEVVQLGRSPRIRVNVWGIQDEQSRKLNGALLMLAGGLGSSFPIGEPDSVPHHEFYDFDETQTDILELVSGGDQHLPDDLARRIGHHATDIIHNLGSWEHELHVPEVMLKALYACHPSAAEAIERAKHEYAAEAKAEGYEDYDQNMALLSKLNLQ
jgi:hypothetical protein